MGCFILKYGLLFCLVFEECERLWRTGVEKCLNAVGRAESAVLAGPWKTVVLRALQVGRPDQEVTEENSIRK